MKILILGGCGYIGSRLCDFFKEEDVTSVDLEWYGANGIKNIVKDYGELTEDFLQGFDVVIALAGYSSERMCKGIMPDVMDNNVVNLYKVASNLKKGQKLIFSSSCRSNAYSQEPYDVSMYLRELTVNLSKADCYGLRLATVNGFSMNFRRESMINSMVDSFNKRGFAEISNGNNKRSIIDIDDLMEVFKRIIYKGNSSNTGVYNVASFNATVREIGFEVGRILGCDVIDHGDSSDPCDFSMNTSKFSDVFGFIPNGNIPTIIRSIQDNYTRMNFTERINPIRYV